MRRIKWIDALKGIACLCILLHHFILCFYPAAYLGDAANLHLKGNTEIWFATSPLSFIVMGDFWVAVFCLLSGFVIAHKVFVTDEKEYGDAVIGRYFRLMLPVFVVSLIVFIMLHLNAFFNIDAGNITLSSWLTDAYTEKTTFGDFLYIVFIKTWFTGMATEYSHAFLMLSELFCGSFAAFLLASAGKKSNKFILIPYAFFALLFLLDNSHLAAFVFGVIIAYVIKAERDGGSLKAKGEYGNRALISLIAGIVMVIFAILLAGYPQEAVPENLYRLLNHLPERIWTSRFYHMIAALLLVAGIRRLPTTKWILGSAPFRFLGKISYGVYLLHIPVMYSVGCLVFVKSFESNGKYKTATLLCLLVTLVLTILLAWLFNILVEKWLGVLIKKCTSLLHDKEAADEGYEFDHEDSFEEVEDPEFSGEVMPEETEASEVTAFEAAIPETVTSETETSETATFEAATVIREEAVPKAESAPKADLPLKAEAEETGKEEWDFHNDDIDISQFKEITWSPEDEEKQAKEQAESPAKEQAAMKDEDKQNKQNITE